MTKFKNCIYESIIKKFNALKDKEFSTFFQYDENFMLALGLTYMVLSEEELIEKDIKNTLMLTGNLSDQEYYNILNTYFQPAPVIHQCINTTNYKSLLKGIRDSIMHNAFTIDYENRVFHINNPIGSEKLICDVSFSWFEKFSKLNINTMKIKTSYQFSFLLPSHFLNNFKIHNKKINTESALEDFLNNISIYSVLISSDEFPYDFEMLLKNICSSCNNSLEIWLKYYKDFSSDISTNYSALDYINTNIQDKLSELDIPYNDLKTFFAPNDLFQSLSNDEKRYIIYECNTLNEQLDFIQGLINDRNKNTNESLLQVPYDLEKRIFQIRNISQTELDKKLTDTVFSSLMNNLDSKEILKNIHVLRTSYSLNHTYSDTYASYGNNFKVSDEDIKEFQIRLFLFKLLSPLLNSSFLYLMLIYTLGINTFVIFKNNDMNYDGLEPLINSFNVYCLYTRAIQDKEKYLNRKGNSLSPQELFKLTEELSQYDKDDSQIISDSRFVKCKGLVALGIIRNSFSHLGRVIYEDFKNGVIKLEDYKISKITNQQNLSGFATCKEEDLLSFFSTLAKSEENIKNL